MNVARSYAYDGIKNPCHISFFRNFDNKYNSISHMHPGFKGNLSIWINFVQSVRESDNIWTHFGFALIVMLPGSPSI